jgi:hypothetical protein
MEVLLDVFLGVLAEKKMLGARLSSVNESA